MGLFLMQPADAATPTWTGSVSTDWANVTNWGGTALTVNNVGSFSTTFTNQPSLTAASAAGGLWLNTGLGQDVTIGAASAQTLTLAGTTLNGNAATAIEMDDTANHNLTFGANVAVTLGSSSFHPNIYLNNAGTLTFSGGLTVFAGRTLTIGGSNALAKVVVAGGITNSTGNVTINTPGTVNYTSAALNTGATAINSGTLLLDGANGSITSSAVSIAGGSLVLDNTTTNNNSRLASSGTPIILYSGNFTYKGSSSATTSESIGGIQLGGGGSASITIAPGSTSYGASVTTTGFSLKTNAGGVLVNGANLGMDSTTIANVGRLFSTAAPGQVGTTASTTDGINAAKQNTQIVSYMLGEATQGHGGTGTATGTANTFVTYNAGTGFRPLNPTDEFTNNNIIATNNTYITAATTAGSTVAINSLVINGGDLSIADGKTLTNTSGALLFVSNNSIKSSGATGAVAFGASGAVTVNTSITAELSALITGATGFTKDGNGTLVVSGNNTGYTGTTYVNGGTLAVTNSNALGSGTITLNGMGGALAASGGPVTIANAISLNYGNNTYGGLIGGTEDLTLTGLVTNNQNSIDYLTVNNTGLTTLAGGLAMAGPSDVNPRNFYINGSGTIKITGAVTNGFTGADSLYYNGTGKLILAGVNTYTGSTQITSGTVLYQNAASFAPSSAIMVTNATLQVQDVGTFSPSIALRGTLESVSGNNTYTSLLGFSDRTAASLISDSGTFTLSNTGAIAATAPLTLGGDGDGVLASSFGASSTGSITKNGAGAWTVSGVNTYTGATTINAGTLKFAKKASLYNSTIGSWTAANIKVASGATLAVNVGGTGEFGNDDVKALLGMAGSATTGFKTGSILGLDTTNASDGNFSYSYDITNAYTGSTLGLTKLGDNTLTLLGSNTYTGDTNVAAGRLDVNGSLVAGSAVKVASGATLGGSGTVNGNVAVAGGSINGNGLKLQGTTTFTGGSTLAGTTTANSIAVSSGTTTISGNTTTAGGITTGATSTLKINGTVDGTVSVSGTLGGNGTITGATTINGTLAPGNSIDTINTGSLTLAATSVLDVELGRNGTLATSDLTNVNGTVTIISGADLRLTLYTGLITPETNDVFFLISNNGDDVIDGVFTSLNGKATTLSQGSQFTWNEQLWEISYQANTTTSLLSGGNDVAIMAVVPEPSTWALLVGGVGMLAFGQRLRRRMA